MASGEGKSAEVHVVTCGIEGGVKGLGGLIILCPVSWGLKSSLCVQ